MEGFDHQMRSWAKPADVEPGTGVAEQLSLMGSVARGEIAGPDFARAWLAARRRALAGGERVREKFDHVLNQVFYMIEDYTIDPDLRDESDMSDGELVDRVRAALTELQTLS
jgi:Bacterial self-protective colicin-like immunity